MHITGIAEQEFYDEEGNRVTVSSQHMLSMKHSKPQQELLIQFGIGKDFHSIDKKVTLKLDTGADVNAFNRTTFQKLFPDVELQPSTIVLENFDKTMVKPMGTFKCFLQWKGKIYRIQAEVMDSEDTPNVLSRETTFLMGILKPCFVVKKVPEIPDGTATMNCNSKAEMKSSKSIQGSQMSCSASTKDVQHIHPDSLKNKPLTQEMIETTYQNVFHGLGKFPGEPYKLRLKENYVPAKHQPRKVPVHLQDAFHEEVQWLVKINVLEPVTEQTEWVNSYVIVEKEVEIDTANAHSPSHTIKKKIWLCLDPKDLNNSLELEPYYSRSIDKLIAKFSGAVIFTIIDMDKGYWQEELHPDSRKYTCMALDIGRVQWKCLPMGMVVASDIFQKKLDSVYIGLPGVTGIADDMIIFGKSELEAWQKPTPIPQDYQEEWIGSQQIETTVQEARSTLLWTLMEFTRNHSRSQEDRFNP